MHGLKIYLADGNFKGTVTMSSDSSKFTAVRVSRKAMHDFDTELDGTGIYFLLVGTDAVYVGQTGLDTLQKRILNKHSADIDIPCLPLSLPILPSLQMSFCSLKTLCVSMSMLTIRSA